MYPVLLILGPVKVETYYVLWGLALCMMVLWTRRRAVARYDIRYNDASDVLIWVIFGVFIGATIGGYLDHWTRYVENPVRLLYFWESGLSSGPGFIGGGLAGLYKLRKLGVSIDNFAESASLPCAFMLFVGRWGCFLNGCCLGIPTNSAWGVKFPFSALPRYPSQLFESTAGLLIGLGLLILERKMHRTPERSAHGAILFPLFLISYGLYRLFFDFLRDGDRIWGLRVGQYTGLFAAAVGIGWLCLSARRLRAAKDARSS